MAQLLRFNVIIEIIIKVEKGRKSSGIISTAHVILCRQHNFIVRKIRSKYVFFCFGFIILHVTSVQRF